MSKDFNTYTTQVSVAQNSKVTTALYGNLIMADANNFAEILSANSKIRVIMNDFSKGKGDRAIKVYYNLDISEVYYIYEKINQNNLTKYYGCKSLDTYKEQTGQYKGMSPIRSISIEYIAGNRYPWKLLITNGYGSGGKITAGKKEVTMFLLDITFIALFRDAIRYIEAFIDVHKAELIRHGLKVLTEQTNQGYNNPDKIPTEPRYEDYYEEIPVQEVSATDSVSTEQETEAKKSTHTMKIQIVQDFIALQGCYCTKVAINGKEYNLYLKDVPAALKTAYKNRSFVTANLYDYQGKLCFDSIA